MSTEDPFLFADFGDHKTYVVCAQDRITRVKRFDRTQCQAALALPDLQKTVQAAICKRMRQLEKGL